MSAQPGPFLTPEEFLELDRASAFRNEYHNGQMYAMAGGTHMHFVILTNLGAELRAGLKKRDCLVSSETRVGGPEGFLTYPDLAVVCGKPKYIDGNRDTLVNPVVLVEVLSKSTEGYDRGLKFAQYRKLEALQEYALVSQDEARVEIFRRQPSGDWLLSEAVGMDATCRFLSVDCAVALAEIYDKVSFEDAATAAENRRPGEPGGRA